MVQFDTPAKQEVSKPLHKLVRKVIKFDTPIKQEVSKPSDIKLGA